MQLPERQLPKEPEEPTKADATPKQDVDAAVVPISINADGTVKETVSTRAHDMEVAVGSHVIVDTPKGKKRKFVVFELKEDLMSVECLDESGDCTKLGLAEFKAGQIELAPREKINRRSHCRRMTECLARSENL